jgi:CubicO group peptidase (beta-lactamase class C family)
LNRHFEDVSASLQLFADDPLAFEPDTGFLYSTYGYTLVSAAVEGATGIDFLTYMASALFEPLGMKQTVPDRDDGDAHVAARYLALGARRVLPAPETDSSNKWAGGGFLSTPDDLVRFGAALLRGDIVGRESAEMMFEPHTLDDGSPNPQNYGLGWRTSEAAFPADSGERIRILHHGGTTIGSQSMLVLVPEREIVVALCTNAYIGGSGPLAQSAVDLARFFAAATAGRSLQPDRRDPQVDP